MSDISKGLLIRTAEMSDLEAIAAVEAECFPAAEAATREEFKERLSFYKEHFWLLFADDDSADKSSSEDSSENISEASVSDSDSKGLTYAAKKQRLIAFVDGMVTDEVDLTDEMYERADMHNESGCWQMIFGVNTLPSYRKHGYAGMLLETAISDAKKQGRKGLVLTCKDKLIHYYAKFGFVNEGISASVHGNVTWYQMRLTF